MKTTSTILCVLAACAAFVAVPVWAGPDHDHDTAQSATAKPVNAMCPIGKEPIIESAGTVEYKGHTVGLCCPSCGKNFLAWSEGRKDTFIAAALQGTEPGHAEHGDKKGAGETGADDDEISYPYPLDFCPVGGKLGSMGDPVVKVYDGREVRFCCAGCIGGFEDDMDAYWAKIDKEIIKQQKRYYPLETCVVMGDAIDDESAQDIVYRNRLVRLCCKMCVRKFNADPKPYLDKLDEAVIEAQRKDYPLAKCIVATAPLGSMGDPTEMIVAGRLLRFCCASCHPKVEADPAKYVALIDAAWEAKGKYVKEEQPKD